MITIPASNRIRLLVSAALLVPAGLFAAAALYDRTVVLAEGKREISRSVAVMHEHARKVFETADLALARVDDRIHGLSWDEIASPETSAFLARLKAPLDQVVSVWIADAQGVMRAGNQPWEPGTGISGRDFFKVQREHDAGTYISAAFRGKATGSASVAISRRRSTGDGRFDGTIHVSLSPEYFARFYAEIAPDLPHSGALLRSDGEELMREPYRETRPRLAPDSPLMRSIQAQPEQGFDISPANKTSTGRERMYAYRKVDGYPLYVALGVDTAVVLRRWYMDLMLFGGVAAAAALMLLFVSWLAVQGFNAERAALAQLRTAWDGLRRETAQREAAEERVRQAQRMEAVGQLTGGIAHDFNNLLTAVLGNLELLRKHLPPGQERLQRHLATAIMGAERGATLTQRLLAFARNQPLKPAAVDVHRLVQDMSGLLRSTLGAGVQVETRFSAGLASAQADANHLELALLNLAANARDAMGGNGRLVIAARESRVEAGEGGDLKPGPYIVLTVADTGEGMDEATLARAVEPFFSTKGVGKGTGLGLSTVHGFAAQSGGRLVLASRKGKGTTAELWLPRAEAAILPAEAAAQVPPEPKPAAAQRRTVLLVDDDPLVLTSTGAMLEDLGHAVIEASSGRQALEILRMNAETDLVISDYSMPGMTGAQLAAELRELRPRMPVLLVTGFADRAEVVAALLPMIAKPFGQAELDAAVEACLASGAVPAE